MTAITRKCNVTQKEGRSKDTLQSPETIVKHGTHGIRKDKCPRRRFIPLWRMQHSEKSGVETQGQWNRMSREQHALQRDDPAFREILAIRNPTEASKAIRIVQKTPRVQRENALGRKSKRISDKEREHCSTQRKRAHTTSTRHFGADPRVAEFEHTATRSRWNRRGEESFS